MDILLLSPIPPPAGGIATWTSGYLSSKEARKHNIDIVNTAVTGERINDFTKKNMIEEIKRNIKILINVRRKLKANRPDIAHINTSCSKSGMIRDLICINLIKNKNTKTILHCHCDTSYMVRGKLSEYIFKCMCENVDSIIVLNSISSKHINKLIKKDSKIIPNFINNEVLEENKTRTTSRKIDNILYVGHIVKTKGCDDIIDVAKKMPDKSFTMIGYLSKEIEQISKPENVKFLGELSHQEVISKMKSSDLFLFPTHTEGFPNVVLEAMACRLPVVSTRVGAIPDMLEEKGGVYIGVKNQKSIIDAINKLEDYKLRKKCSDWNNKKVNDCYTLDKVINMIFEEYKEIK